MMVISVIVGSACGFVGVYISYYVDIASGASIVLTAAAVFMLALVYSSVRLRIAQMRGEAIQPQPSAAAAHHAVLE